MQPNPECRLRDVDLLCELAAGEAVTPALRVDEFLEGRMWLFVFDQAAAGRNFAASTPLNNETKPLTVKHWVGGSIPARCTFSIHSSFTLLPRSVSGCIPGTDASSPRRSLAPPAVELIDIFLRDWHPSAKTKGAARYL